MKLFVFLSSIFLLTVSAGNCHKKNKNNTDSGVYKGRLEIKAACLNYTIKVIKGNIDTALVEANWTDATTKKTYTNVFALGSVCSFPSTIQEGEEFYFSMDASPIRNCAVCMLYYPTPSKKLSIKVIEK
jgi:hypothetical protein